MIARNGLVQILAIGLLAVGGQHGQTANGNDVGQRNGDREEWTPREPLEAWITTRDGKQLTGMLETPTLTFSVGTDTRIVKIGDLLSFHSAEPASATETARITADLATLAGADIAANEVASADLTDIGLPVLTPLLRTFQDTDAHEPDYRYRLFGRIIPGYADGINRELDLVRLVGGGCFRGKLATDGVILLGEDGDAKTIPAASIRRLAIRQAAIHKSFELQALHHCTYVGFMDTGIAVAKGSKLRADCEGFVRLSFDEDGWSSDPDGIKEPLPGKRKLQEGFRWGAVLGRVGPAGDRWLIGQHLEKNDFSPGRFFIVINDNEHWQNNIGSYRVQLDVANAYDVGDPR